MIPGESFNVYNGHLFRGAVVRLEPRHLRPLPGADPALLWFDGEWSTDNPSLDRAGTGGYDAAIRAHIAGYDRVWSQFQRLADENPSCASPYVAQSFAAQPAYDADPGHGMRQSADRYRELAR